MWEIKYQKIQEMNSKEKQIYELYWAVLAGVKITALKSQEEVEAFIERNKNSNQWRHIEYGRKNNYT